MKLCGGLSCGGLERGLRRDVPTGHPVFVAFTRERRREAQETGLVGKDADHARPTSHRHMIVLNTVRGGQPLAPVSLAERVDAERIRRGLLQPVGERAVMGPHFEHEPRQPSIGFGARRTPPQVPQILDEPFAPGGRGDFRQRVPHVVHLAALMHAVREEALHALQHAGMFVGHDVLDAVQPARDQIFTHGAPAGRRLARAEPHTQVFAVPVRVDADDPQYGRVADGPVAPHALDMRIDDQIGIGLAAERPLAPRGEPGVERLRHRGDRRRRHARAAPRFDDRTDFARRYALHIHLREGQQQGLLAALIAREQRGLKLARPVAGNAQLQTPHPRGQLSGAIAVADASAGRGSRVPVRSHKLGKLAFNRLLNQRGKHRTQRILGTDW